MTAFSPPALFLAADAIDTGSQRLMGRQSAGHGFLRGFVDVVHEAAELRLFFHTVAAACSGDVDVSRRKR